MSKTRESNFDLLRILSAVAVVLLHVSGHYFQLDEMNVATNCHFPIFLLNHLTRFAVPCYFMLSGAFVLADQRNADHKYFYQKSFKNIGITGIVFCLLYMLYKIAKLILAAVVLGKYDTSQFFVKLLAIIMDLLAGKPFFHLWYLFTVAGLYLAVPFVIRLAADLRDVGGGKSIRENYNSISYSCKRKLYNQ